jgi:putative tryptophan/tyrosine transport system substrate-binding protein
MWLSAVGCLITLALSVLVAPPASDARQAEKVFRVGFLGSVPPPILEAFRQGLHALGWVEGQNLVIEHQSAAGKEDRLPDLAAALVRLQVDIIVAPGPVAIRAAKQATTTIPIVMVGTSDPVALGLVASLARPGGNLTGLTVAAWPELAGKWLELLKESAPGISRVAVLWDATGGSFPSSSPLEAAARSLGVQVQRLEVRGPDAFDRVFQTAIQGRAQALIVLTTPMLHVHQARIVDFAAVHGLPAIAYFRDFAEAGGLMAYGPNLPELFRRAASYVDKILKSAKPGDLPVERPMKFELVINLKTAQALGLTIPPTLLFQATDAIR